METRDTPTGPVRFTADRGDAGHRLDHALVRRIHDVSRLSRTSAQAWITSGAVTVDGRVVHRVSTRLREGATVEVELPDSAPRRVRPGAESMPLDTIYEDGALLAVSKPAGMVVHPSYKNSSGTLLNAVLGRPGHDSHAARPGVVTRLDKDTSGVVLVALTTGGHQTIQRAATRGLVRKTYLAVVAGLPHPEAGTIALPLGRDPDDRRRMKVMENGAASETRYEVLAHADGVAVLRCELVTGRTHQIRVHLAARGWPIVGDRVYGHAHPTLSRQALDAWRGALPHPVTGVSLTITAPPPADLRETFPDFASLFAQCASSTA